MDKNYFLLAAVWLVFFSRGIGLGYVVDDVVRRRLMDRKRKDFKGFTWGYIQSYIREGFYGAGLFANSKIDHASILIVHLLNSLLVYSIIEGQMGFIAALLWLINPVNNQVSLWLNGRRYALSILAVLLSFKFIALFPVLYPFAAWLHVSGILLPVIYLFTPEWYLGLAGIVIGIVCGWKRILRVMQFRKSEFNRKENGEENECQVLAWRKIVLYVKSIGFYFCHILVPLKPRMYHEFLYYFSRYPEAMKQGYSLNLEFWVGLSALGYLGYEIAIGSWGSFWAIWFLVFISQWCNVYNVTMHVADRYCSLAGIGLMALLAWKIALLWAFKPIYGVAALTAVGMFYLMQYAPLFRAYKSYGDFLRYHINLEPSGVEARHIMALNYLNAEKPDPMSAYHLLKDGLRHRPNDFKLLITMAQTMFTIGKWETGLKLLDRAEAVCPIGDEKDCKEEFNKLREQFRQQELIRKVAKQMKTNSHLSGV